MRKETFIRLIFALLLCCPAASFAQATNTVTVTGSTGANNSYANLRLAFDAINNKTIQTGNNILIAISASVNDGSYSAVLNAGNWTSLKIYPTKEDITLSGNPDNPLIHLNGADKVTLDGRVNQTGTTGSLTLSCTNPNDAGSTILFSN